MFNLINGDCLEELKKIKSNTIDLVFTSPPYNMNLRIRNGKYCSRQIVKELTTKYKDFNDNLPMDEYFEFNKNILNECLRVSDLVFYNVQFLTGNKPALFRLLGEFHLKIKEFIVWDKMTAEPAIRDGVMNSQFEVLIVLQNSSPQSRRFELANFDRGTMSNLWKIKRGKKYDKSHGAVFPIDLASTVISVFSKEGDVVLDPFMGTGTTGKACRNLGRGFVGIEIDKDYYDFSNRRINEEISLFD